MTLTGKCKEDFESYLEELDRRDIEGVYCDYNGTFYCYNDYHFSCLPESMQYGVYVDWFDSVGINVIGDRSRSILNNTSYFSNVWDVYDGESSPLDFHNTLAEARTAAIEKANKIYNEH
jgi:hypothetical protein